jgi:ribosomal protein L7/L12
MTQLAPKVTMEIKSLNCPNCSAPLEVSSGDTAIECTHCGSDLRISASGEASLFFRNQPGETSGPPGLDMAEVARFVRSGQKINAIKLVREKTRWGLKEAKDFVDAFEAGKPLPPPPPARDYPRPSQKTTGAPDWSTIRQYLEARNKIQAIKIYREQTGATLKDAKEAVEMFERGQIPPAPNYPAPAPSSGINLVEIRQLLAKGNKIEAVKRYRQQTGQSLEEALNFINAMPEAKVSLSSLPGSGLGCFRILFSIGLFLVLILGGCGFAVQRGDLYQCAIHDIARDREVVQALGEPIQISPFVIVIGYESSSDFSGNSTVDYGALTYLKGANAGSLVQVSASHSTGSSYSARGDLNPNGQKISVLSSGDIETCNR